MRLERKMLSMRRKEQGVRKERSGPMNSFREVTSLAKRRQVLLLILFLVRERKERELRDVMHCSWELGSDLIPKSSSCDEGFGFSLSLAKTGAKSRRMLPAD